MDYTEILEHVLAHIDDHIQGDLDAGTLATVAGFSTYHFCRVFQWGVGYSVMEYVRSRRLAYAAAELSSGRRIIDIALDYGFETHSGFSRAFRRYYGCAPETYRMHAYYRRPSPPTLAHKEKYLIGGIVMEPKFVSLPAVKLIGFTMKTTTKDNENTSAIPAFWTEYLTDGRMERLHNEDCIKSHTEYGACFPENPETGEFDYIIGVELKEGASAPEGYQACGLPSATYAVFSTPPTVRAEFTRAIQGVWQYIFSEWFPGSGYEYAPGCVDFELYDERCMGDTGCVCDIYIPVVKR